MGRRFPSHHIVAHLEDQLFDGVESPANTRLWVNFSISREQAKGKLAAIGGQRVAQLLSPGQVSHRGVMKPWLLAQHSPKHQFQRPKRRCQRPTNRGDGVLAGHAVGGASIGQASE